MRVAVTGASGFLGRHVMRALRGRGATLIAISRHPEAPLDDSVTPVAFDIADADDSTFDRIGRPDILLHLAWGGLPNYHSLHHLERELPMHSMFLGSCIRAGLRRLVVAGTCLEYGMQSGELIETMPAAPATAYAEAKQALHRHLSALQDEYGFGLGWLRLFYLYGPGQAPTSLFPQLRAAIESGASSFDMSRGDQIRDFLAVETAADHIAALTLDHRNAAVVNVCSGRPVTVVDMAQTWLREWGADITLNRGARPYPDYEPFAFWGNPGRLHDMLQTI